MINHYFDWWILVVNAYLCPLHYFDWWSILFWWMLVINPGVHIRSNLPPGKCKLTVCHRKSFFFLYINLGKSSTNRQFPIAMSNYQRLSVFVFPPLATFGAAARAMSFRIDSAACKHKPFERGEVLDHHHSSIQIPQNPSIRLQTVRFKRTRQVYNS